MPDSPLCKHVIFWLITLLHPVSQCKHLKDPLSPSVDYVILEWPLIGQHHSAHLSWTVFSLSSADLTNWHFSVDLVGLVIKLNQLIMSSQREKNIMIMIIVHMYESLYLITSLLMNRYCYCSYERVIVLNYSVCAKHTNCVLSY